MTFSSPRAPRLSRRSSRIGPDRVGGAAMIDLFHSGSQTRAVRFVMILSLLVAAGCCWGGYALFQSYGLSPGDGGVLAPLGTRLSWGMGVAALGLATAWGMWLYGRNYVRSIRYDPHAQVLHIRTLGMFGDGVAAVPVGRVRRSTFRGGRMAGMGDFADVSVNAPWFSMKVEGRALPYILDAQGRFNDPQFLARLIRA
jgi:hypothetical protein